MNRSVPLGRLLAVVVGLSFAAAALAAEHGDRVEVGPNGVVVERGGDSERVEIHIADKDRHHSTHLGRDGWIEVDDRGDALVRVFGDIHVPAGKQVLDDVVAVFGSVEVDGTVEGDVVAVLGSVHVRDGAEVQGDVVSVGGVVDQEDGSVIQGQTVSVGFLPVSWGVRALPLTLSAIGAGFLAAVLGGWIFAFAFPNRLVRVGAIASRRTGASLLLGLASVPGFVALVVLMFVTVVGIPLAFLLPLAYVILTYAGNLAASYVLGCKLTGRRPGSGGLVGPIVAGSLLVALFFVVGAVLWTAPGVTRPLALFSALLGCLLAIGLTAIGTGAFLLSRFGTQPKDVVHGSETTPLSTPLPAASPPTP